MAEVEILGEIAAAGRDVAAGVIDVKNYHLETADEVAERIDAVLAAGVPAERLDARPRLRLQPDRPLGDARQAAGLVAGRDLVLGAPPTSHRDTRRHAWTATGSRCSAPGSIGDFYTKTLHGQRGRDRVRVVYSRSAGARRGVPRALGHPGVDDRPRGRRRPSRHRRRRRRPAELPPRGGRRAGGRGRQGRPVHEAARADRRGGAPDARRWSRTAGVFGGYLEDLCYTPKTLKAIASVAAGAIGDVTWVRSRETHPGPH